MKYDLILEMPQKEIKITVEGDGLGKLYMLRACVEDVEVKTKFDWFAKSYLTSIDLSTFFYANSITKLADEIISDDFDIDDYLNSHYSINPEAKELIAFLINKKIQTIKTGE